jgi:hypothetical protein
LGIFYQPLLTSVSARIGCEETACPRCRPLPTEATASSILPAAGSASGGGVSWRSATPGMCQTAWGPTACGRAGIRSCHTGCLATCSERGSRLARMLRSSSPTFNPRCCLPFSPFLPDLALVHCRGGCLAFSMLPAKPGFEEVKLSTPLLAASLAFSAPAPGKWQPNVLSKPFLLSLSLAGGPLSGCKSTVEALSSGPEDAKLSQFGSFWWSSRPKHR